MAGRVLKRGNALAPWLRLGAEQNLDALGLELGDFLIDVGDKDGHLAAVAGLALGDKVVADELAGGADEEEVDDCVVEPDGAGLWVFKEDLGLEDARVKVLGGGEVLGEEGDGGDGAEGVCVGHVVWKFGESMD